MLEVEKIQCSFLEHHHSKKKRKTSTHPLTITWRHNYLPALLVAGAGGRAVDWNLIVESTRRKIGRRSTRGSAPAASIVSIKRARGSRQIKGYRFSVDWTVWRGVLGKIFWIEWRMDQKWVFLFVWSNLNQKYLFVCRSSMFNKHMRINICTSIKPCQVLEQFLTKELSI